MEKNLLNIYLIFLKIGTELLGGGFVIVPLMKKYLKDERRWLTDEEICDFYALSQTIPGIIAVNISIFTGYKLKGKLGALSATMGVITSPIIVICLIATILDKIMTLKIINYIFFGITSSVIVLIYLSIKEMFPNSVYDKFSWFIFLTSFALSFFLKISPVYIILGAIIFTVIIKLIQERTKNDLP